MPSPWWAAIPPRASLPSQGAPGRLLRHPPTRRNASGTGGGSAQAAHGDRHCVPVTRAGDVQPDPGFRGGGTTHTTPAAAVHPRSKTRATTRTTGLERGPSPDRVIADHPIGGCIPTPASPRIVAWPTAPCLRRAPRKEVPPPRPSRSASTGVWVTRPPPPARPAWPPRPASTEFRPRGRRLCAIPPHHAAGSSPPSARRRMRRG